jgi:hypothetical protein
MPLSPADAELLLTEWSPPEGLWPLHSRQVARVADLIAAALAEAGTTLERPSLVAQALLHDVGRAKTHGPLHGWTGYVMLRERGHADAGRGCLTHWLKGRSFEEVRDATTWEPSLAEKAFAALEPHPWDLLDTVLSFADSSVQHTTIVPFQDRHQDLLDRYGDSTWLRRATELATAHGAEIDAALGFPVETLLSPLFGDSTDA